MSFCTVKSLDLVFGKQINSHSSNSHVDSRHRSHAVIMTQQLGSGQPSCRVRGIWGKITMELPSEQTQTTQNYNAACQPSNVFTETTQHFFLCNFLTTEEVLYFRSCVRADLIFVVLRDHSLCVVTGEPVNKQRVTHRKG